MSKKLLLYQYHSQLGVLRKIINSWNLIPGSSTDEFDTMANKILSNLHKGSDFEKIQDIITSDLVTIYGFYNYEIDVESFANEIMHWWESV